MSWLKDIFYNIGNQRLDAARVCAVWAVVSYSFAFLYALIVLKHVPEWSSLGTGYLQVLGGAVAFVAGKDIAAAKAGAPKP